MHRLLFATVAVWSTLGQAAVIYNNFGPSNGTSLNGFTVGNYPNFNVNWVLGYAFTPTDTFTLASLDLALQRDGFGTPDGVTVSLWSDSSDIPGSIIESVSANLGNATYNSGRYLTIQSSVQPVLTAGEQYWIVAQAVGQAGWWNTPQGLLGPRVTRNDGTTNFTSSQINVLGAFRVHGDLQTAAVPEPGTFGLLAGVLAGFLFHVRRVHR